MKIELAFHSFQSTHTFAENKEEATTDIRMSFFINFLFSPQNTSGGKWKTKQISFEFWLLESKRKKSKHTMTKWKSNFLEKCKNNSISVQSECMRIKENVGKNKMNKGRRGFILSNGSEIKIELNFHFTLFHFPSFNVSPSSYIHFISSSMDPFVLPSILPRDSQTVINDFQSQTEKCFRKYWNRSNRETVGGKWMEIQNMEFQRFIFSAFEDEHWENGGKSEFQIRAKKHDIRRISKWDIFHSFWLFHAKRGD